LIQLSSLTKSFGERVLLEDVTWQISDGATGMASWRRDGRELYFLAADRSIMAVSVTISPDFEFGKPKALFRVPDAIGLAPGSAMITPSTRSN